MLLCLSRFASSTLARSSAARSFDSASTAWEAFIVDYPTNTLALFETWKFCLAAAISYVFYTGLTIIF
jgi:hypothetical protein